MHGEERAQRVLTRSEVWGQRPNAAFAHYCGQMVMLSLVLRAEREQREQLLRHPVGTRGPLAVGQRVPTHPVTSRVLTVASAPSEERALQVHCDQAARAAVARLAQWEDLGAADAGRICTGDSERQD